MASKEINALTDIIENWQRLRVPLANKFTNDGLREFIAVHNKYTRELISLVDRRDPEFWSAWTELGQNAGTMSAGAKLFVDGKDVTNL